MSNVEKIKVSIVGGSGYAGGELLRLLLAHPNVEVVQVTSRQYAKFPVTIVHPNLRNYTNLKFCKPDEVVSCDLLFLALPNGESQKNIDHWMTLAPKIIDLGADFRLKELENYQKWYGEHQKPELIEKFVYGIAELHREEIKKANYVASAGCEATCSILTLYPLYKKNLIDTYRTVIDAKLGSSAAGAKSSMSSHHPERAGSVRSYKPTMHRHTAEIEQEMSLAGNEKVNVSVSATAIEMVRGILVTCHVYLKEDVSELDLWKIYRQEYQSEPFIRLINDKMGNYRFPEPKILEGTNFCDIGLEKDKLSNRVVVVGAIDNLVKGTAGQAVQAMNLMYGFEERTGLEFSGLHPV
jgi:LysW-gamma-L-alpha-aminoadipyl-6-phosphate/LysW-L-glutamyl-5-phosphate reductase